MEDIIINLKRISDEYNDIPLPEYATEGSSGMDIRAALKDPMIIKKGEIVIVPTNLSVEIPLGYEIQVRPRSGLAVKHGIGILNSPGTVDSDYRGEIKIILFNFGKEDFTVQRGERIAQLIITKVFKANFIEGNFLKESKRGSGGFGHTGKD
ncbi:MAG: dUTP diphosphatase [Ignavibacteriaceae bacterium]|nr:dUTP diphosphatase [Ignavibacteriaceae bacterium]